MNGLVNTNTYAKGKFVGGFFLCCDDGPEADDEGDDVVELWRYYVSHGVKSHMRAVQATQNNSHGITGLSNIPCEKHRQSRPENGQETRKSARARRMPCRWQS